MQYIFGSGGSALRPIHDCLIDHPEMTHILSLHEMSAVAMADGYARAAGDAAFALVHGAVGAVNALDDLRSEQGDFSTIEEFYQYWRSMPVKGAAPPLEPEALEPEEAIEEGV